MSNIWPPRNFSTADGTNTTTTSQYKGSSLLARSVNVRSNIRTVYGSESRLGANTPSFASRAKTGDLPMLSLGYSQTRTRGTIGSRFTQSTPFVGNFSTTENVGNFTNDLVPTGVVYGSISSLRAANLENKVRQQVFANLKGQDLNLSVDFAERDKTVRMIAIMIKRIANALKALKAGNFLAAAQSLGLSQSKNLSKRAIFWSQTRNISSGWLELQYGWKPLAMSIYGGLEFLRKSHNRSEYRVFHARGSVQESASSLHQSAPFEVTVNTSVTMTKKVTLKVKRQNPVLGDLSSLGITNPLMVAWELLPFSFVIDWALPIGSFIDQLDAGLGYTFGGACVTTFTRSDYVATERGMSILPEVYAKARSDLRQAGEQVTCSRNTFTGFANMYSLPYFKDPGSNLHVANALALLVATHPRR